MVAQEVKHLATRSSSASKEVVAIIKEIEDTTQLAITTVTDGASKAQELQEVTKQTGYVIDEMSEVAEHAQKQAVSIRGIAKEVSDLTELIRSSTAQQESASAQVVFALNELSVVAEQEAQVSQLVFRTALELEKLSADLSLGFKITAAS